MFSRKSSVGLNDGLPIVSPLSTKSSINDLREANNNNNNNNNNQGMMSRKTSFADLNYKKPRQHTSQKFKSGVGEDSAEGNNNNRRLFSNDGSYTESGSPTSNNTSTNSSSQARGLGGLSKKSSISDFGSRIMSQHKERKNDKYLEREIEKFNTKYRVNSSSSHHGGRIGSGIRKSSKRIVSEVKELHPAKFKSASNVRKAVTLFCYALTLYVLILKPLKNFILGSGSSSSSHDAQNFQFRSKSIDEIPLSERYLQSSNQVSKFKNDKFRLSVPFLDTAYQNYHVGGHPIVKNKECIKMINKGGVGKHSVLLSKEKLPSDFEMQISFILEPGNHKIKDSKTPGDGINFFFTKMTDFVNVDGSSYSQKQFKLQNDLIDPRNRDLMGVPKNLPAESLVLDFFTNGQIENTDGMQKWNNLKTPHLSLLSTTTSKEYNFHDDGVSNAHDIVKLSSNLLYSERDDASLPKEIKLRIIKISNVLFKVDIDYTGFGLSWLEVLRFEKFGDRFPNLSANQVHFGISALNGDQTATFQVMKVDCFNYLWNDPSEQNADVKIENVMEMYRREYDIIKIDGWFDIKSLYRKSGLLPREIYEFERDGYLKKKAMSNSDNQNIITNDRLSSAKTNNNNQGTQKISNKKRSFVGKLLLLTWILLILFVALYILSLYLRVQKKKFKPTRSTSNSLL